MLLPAERTLFSLGTLIQLKAYGTNGEEAISWAVDRLHAINSKMSAFAYNSELSRINRSAGNSFVSISPDTYAVIRVAVQYAEYSGGAYDPTIRPLVQLWGIGSRSQTVPSAQRIRETLALVNYRDILFDEKSSSVMLRRKGQALDLGGIAKGYAADEIRDIYRGCRVECGLIDLGGNIYAYGAKPDGSPWQIGIQDPLKPRGIFLGVLSLSNQSVVTSGGYEKYFNLDGLDGRKMHHILDPQTGYPSDSNLISVTIVADDSLAGDGWSTGAFILGLPTALDRISHAAGIEAVFVTETNQIVMTPQICASFRLTCGEYRLTDPLFNREEPIHARQK